MRKSTLTVAAMFGLLASTGAFFPPGGSVAPPERTATSSTPAGAEKNTQGTNRSPVSTAAWDRWGLGMPRNRRSGYPNGPGWSNRHVQRMARKRRNALRHRKSARGRR